MSETQQQEQPMSSAAATAATSTTQNKPKEGWFHKNFIRPANQDAYPNSKKWLKSSTFAPFGEVVQNPATHGGEPAQLEWVAANQGSARKWLDVTHMKEFYGECESGEKAECVVNLFVCQARELEERVDGKVVFPVEILERHPFTAQMFVPIGVSPDERNVRYLVIVAPTLPNHHASSATSTSSVQSPGSTRKGSGSPDLDNIKAFIAHGDQAVTYSAGTWHAPMIVLGERHIDFVVVQYSNGVALEDCQEFGIKKNGLVVDLGAASSQKARL